MFHNAPTECMASFLIEVNLCTTLDLHIQLTGLCHCVHIWVAEIHSMTAQGFFCTHNINNTHTCKHHMLLVTTKHFHVHDGTCTCTQSLIDAPGICLQWELLSPVCVLQMSRMMETYCLHIQWRRTSLPGRGIKWLACINFHLMLFSLCTYILQLYSPHW